MKYKLAIHSEDREILLVLFKEKQGIDIYTFHEKYLLSPGQIARVVRKYQIEGVLDFDGKNISLTQHGKNWLIRNRLKVLQGKRELPWKVIPEDFKQEKISLDHSNLPDLKKLLRFFR